MFFKLSLRNVKRSYKDYSIYFVTLILAVTVFYVFNSLASQQFLSNVFQSSTLEGIREVENLIRYLSVFVAIILSFLIIYANSFLFRRRKKELGIYLALGMERQTIGRILLMETLVIGVISLGVGIGIGTLLSQVFGVLIFRMMNVSIEELRFVFSFATVGRTLLYFGFMFLAVAMLNVVTISRYKIINLIYGRHKSQNARFQSGGLAILSGTIGFVTLGWAYFTVLKKDAFRFIFLEENLFIVFGAGFIGTLLLFFSLSGLLVTIIKKTSRFYYCQLNMFTMRQLSSRIQTNWFIVSLMSLMIFVSISSVSVGLALEDYYRSDNEIMTPFDVTISNNRMEQDVSNTLSQFNVNLSTFTTETFPLTSHFTELSFDDFIPFSGSFTVFAFHLSEVNAILNAQGIEPVTLSEGEAAGLINSTSIKEADILNKQIMINEERYTISHVRVDVELLTGSKNFNDQLSVVVPDDIELEPWSQVISFNFDHGIRTQENAFTDYVLGREDVFSTDPLDDIHFDPVFEVVTRNILLQTSQLLSITMTFASFYIGAIFILVSMTILALQQLVDAVDSEERYTILGKLGVDKRQQNKALLTQIGIYFLVPLSVAASHSAVGLFFFNRILIEETTRGIGNPVLMTFSFFMVFTIYLIYFVTTYWQAKRMVN